MRDLIATGLVGTGMGIIITFGMTMGLVAVVSGTIVMSVGCCLTKEN